MAVDSLQPVADCHHPILLDPVIKSGSPETDTNINHNTKPDFNNANFSAICSYLEQIDWSTLLTTATVDEAVDILYSHLYLDFDYFIPIKNSKTSNPHPPDLSES